MSNILRCIPRICAWIRKSGYNWVGIVLLAIFGVFGVIVIIIAFALTSNTELHCDRDKAISKHVSSKLLETSCSYKYEQQFHFLFPMYTMFIINYGIVFIASVIYTMVAKQRLRKFDFPESGETTTSNSSGNDENQLMLPRNTFNRYQGQGEVPECLTRFSTSCVYIIHLIVSRIIPLLAFGIVFNSTAIPSNFLCPLWPGIPINSSTIRTSHVADELDSPTDISPGSPPEMFINCTNPKEEITKTVVSVVGIVDIIYVVLACCEILNIARLTWNDREFLSDKEFCPVYLLRIRERTGKTICNIRKEYISDEELHDFGSNGKESSRKLEEIYVDVIIQNGRERVDAYPQKFDRQKIYKCYLETSKSTADLFKPTKGKHNQKYPRTILVIGRPGIGKTTFTRKLLCQWKKEDEFWSKKVVILLRLQSLKNESVSLRDLLADGYGQQTKDFETVYQLILLNPNKTILIFDGLSELAFNNEHLSAKTETVSCLNKKMPVFSILKMLINGRLLPGATVVVTSRPTTQCLCHNLHFDKIVEIMGFSEQQIKEYVRKFCQERNKTSEMIWNQINGSPELRSLCYIPVISYIVCLTFEEIFKNDESEEQLSEERIQRGTPKTITELYMRAIKVVLYRHHPRLKSLKLNLNTPFPEDFKNDLAKLKEVAKTGIEEGRLIFERASTDEFSKLVDCGFFYQLPYNRRNVFCFLHLTIQEFFAALHVVDGTENVEKFLVEHVDHSKWHLVIQFVAGLLGDKIGEAKITNELTDDEPFQCMRQSILGAVQQRFEEWTMSLGTKSEKNKIALLGIKCLYELQETDIMKSAAMKFKGELNGRLYLTRLTITPVDSKAVFEFLGNTINLKRLHVIYSEIEGEYSYHKMETLLFNNPVNAITFFSWVGNVTDQGVKYLSSALEGEYCKLTELNLRSNRITNQGVKYLSKALKSQNCKLSKLVLTSHGNDVNKIDNRGAGYLSDALKSFNCELTKLYLDHTKIGDEGVKCLCDALESGTSKITRLSLRNSSITTQGIGYLCKTMKERKCKITKLYLDRNRIGVEGAQCLSSACKYEHCSLVELGLNYNNITDDGVLYFSDAVKDENCKLTKISLNNNAVTDQGVRYLSEAIVSEQSKLISLNLNDNKITRHGLKYLIDALYDKNCTLATLCVMGNPIDEQEWVTIYPKLCQLAKTNIFH